MFLKMQRKINNKLGMVKCIGRKGISAKSSARSRSGRVGFGDDDYRWLNLHVNIGNSDVDV